MLRRHKVSAILVVMVLMLSGCTYDNTDGGVSRSGGLPSGAPAFAVPNLEPANEADAVVSGHEPEPGYIDLLALETISQFYEPGMSEYERAKAAFDYMIETAALVNPVGLDLWRIRGNYTEPPSFVENRSLSILLYHMGMCEDYAAALTMLLRGMGLEAEYVPGLTYSTQGELVDHAWTVAKIDGIWYHLDCQLEQNISRRGSIRYKYFMRGDATFANSHRWGQNLIDSGLLTAPQNEEIARSFIAPDCPRDYPTPQRRSFTLPEEPDPSAIQAGIDAEFQEYERVHGALEPIEMNIIPPVFALDGYGPRD